MTNAVSYPWTGYQCGHCSGTGTVYDWIIPGYRWGTISGVKNRRDDAACHCCMGRGKHDDPCPGYEEPSLLVPGTGPRSGSMKVDTDRPPILSHLVPDASESLFKEAAQEAVNAALKVKMDQVPGISPFYNVYLDRSLQVVGFTTNCKSMRRASLRRKQVFTTKPDVYWGISFSRNTGKATAHHRIGYRARFGIA